MASFVRRSSAIHAVVQWRPSLRWRSSFGLDPELDRQRRRRNKQIRMHPHGTGKDILPGGFVVKVNETTGVERMVLLEHEKGYFWAFKELELTNNKPILSNSAIVPAPEAEQFPLLRGLQSVSEELPMVDLPEFVTHESKDATAQCTLVAISYKDFGAKLLPSWTTPFTHTLRTGKHAEEDKYQLVRISINQGWMAKVLLRPFIVSGTKNAIPKEDHPNTLLYFGDAPEMRDVLRMHNPYTGYVYLVDGIGRVRWAGSGEGSEEEVQTMIQCARDITKPVKVMVRPGPRVGKKGLAATTTGERIDR